MRIGVVNWTARQAGGIETYLDGILARLADLGHEVAYLHELDAPADRERITLPAGAPRWCAAQMGAKAAVAALRGWRPDLVWVHGLKDLELEAACITVAPAVYVAHAYSGTCISGTKAFQNPSVRPCGRRFGWPCLLRFYPRRCGGWSPVTMLREYRCQHARLRLLRRYKRLVTISEHVRQEYLRQGFAAERVTTLPAPPTRPAERGRRVPLADAAGPWRLLFLGRMEVVKGGQVLLQALPLARQTLNRAIHVTFAGDGDQRAAWERQAARLPSGVTAEFTGWVGADDVDDLWARCDLAVVPSLWPEPFGLVGPETFRHGVPVAAFAVGGIPEWLHDGVNGHLAPGDPPTATGLAQAIAKCLRAPAAHAALCAGATASAARVNGERHLDELQQVFREVAGAPAVLPLSPVGGRDGR